MAIDGIGWSAIRCHDGGHVHQSRHRRGLLYEVGSTTRLHGRPAANLLTSHGNVNGFHQRRPGAHAVTCCTHYVIVERVRWRSEQNELHLRLFYYGTKTLIPNSWWTPLQASINSSRSESFTFAGPAGWNSLPTSLREITNYNSCKRVE